VMLVLLIIFLITIPVVTQTIAMSLPKETNIARQTKPENIEVSVNKDGDNYRWTYAIVLPTDIVVPEASADAGPGTPFSAGAAGQGVPAAAAAVARAAPAPEILAGLAALAEIGKRIAAGGAAPPGDAAAGDFPDLDPMMALGSSTPLFATLGHWQRLDLPAAPAPLAAELRREWPGDEPALGAALRELGALFEDGGRLLAAAPALPPRGLFARMALRRAVARAAGPGRGRLEDARPFEATGGHPLPEALLALQPFLSHLDGPPVPLALARVLGGAMRGLHVADGGEQALRELFRRHGSPSTADHDEAAALHGVVEAVELGAGGIKGLRLAGSSDLHAARVVLLATGAAGFARLLPKGASGRVIAALNRLRPARRVLAVNFVVRAGTLPPPLGPAALLMLGGAPVLLQSLPAVRHPSDEGDPGEREHVLCAAAAVPAEPWTRDAVLAAAGRIRAAVAEAIPFFERHVLHESIPALVGAGDGEPFADAADPLYAPLDGAPLGVTGLPIHGPLKNLFLAGRDVLPGLGLEGEIYAGIEAAAHAAAALGYKERPGR